MNIHELSNYFQNAIWTGTEKFKTRCPHHGDRTASLHVSVLEGKILLHCFAGCHTNHILDLIGLSFRDLFLENDLTPTQKKYYRKAKNRLETIRLLNREMFVLTRFNDSRLNDSAVSRDKNYLKIHPEFRPLPNETWEREQQAIERIRKMTGKLLWKK